MERKKASDFPQELLNLFDLYVHGEMSRRAFLDGAQKFAVGGVSAGALFEMLKPNYAWAIQVPPDDARIVAKRVDVPSPQGNGTHQGLSRPSRRNAEKLPGVLVVHENRGLNPYIEDVARRLAIANFIAFAPDGLTSVGGYPGDDEKGADAVQAGRRGQDAGGFRRRRRVAEVPARFDRQARRGRLLFRRRRRQQARGEHGLRPRRRRSVLWPAAERRRRGEDQGADQRPICRARHAHHRRLAGVRRRAQRGWRHPRGAHLQGRQPRLPQRHDARATTRRRRKRRGSGRSIGSTNICGLEGAVRRTDRVS